MKIVLLKDIGGLGKRFELKNVADGHALNFLIPKKMAEPATPQAVERVKKAVAQAEVKRKVQEDLLVKNLKGVEGAEIIIKGKASDKGHLFAGIHAAEISKAVKEGIGADIPAEFIDISEAIKTVGAHEALIKIGDKKLKLRLKVEAFE
ncbi:MAG: 50S ribosomal protein L9 [Parcubacteria group bacterium GW2011_GWA2_47_21]|nr:MAG: 50S ribosomal protein L9 [Parcubacteria group bacterium GW2011_GWA2_47_21]